MNEFLRMTLSETANFCLGLAGFLSIVYVCYLVNKVLERMVKFCANRINAIRKINTVCK